MNYSLEQKLLDQGFQNICGIDEAGRGPLAGPLVAAAVILDPQNLNPLSELKESKSLTSAKREYFFDIVRDNVISWSVGVVHNTEIDKHGLGFANKIAMKRAWTFLHVQPDYILIDHMPGVYFETPFESFKKGDANILSIAAASIIAKVIHDRIMDSFAKVYPNYGFDLHKGYGTAMHLEKINQLGLCPIHRTSFKPLKNKLL
ncbi:ribonuclease HII [Candidatus Falkowbacteria bacterium RIFOXYA2_FULL_35_8]|uniref:Ribonuclease HII n=1 Tax=Candidatus Falkowbacteria bacterium RIFOXYC2_FULL_36_12 TaxID=1798002 RepID=A0A1F5T304_9BACT|nr:MAG: ribonuclease HII [Candidatus Falkowbacteria bacterium RIFOXYC2_FULL_36_12]OGF34213.1 MAG: ribonuclease HII [Candidatus Falkowbacteria bacterium RIFOXYA2_FULL_35_8]